MAAAPLLTRAIQRVADRERRFQLWLKLAGCWAGSAVLGLLLISIQRQSGWATSLGLPFVAVTGVLSALAVFVQHKSKSPDWRRVAARIEARHPELDGRLITAVQQEVKPGSELNYFQERLVNEVLAHDQKTNWPQQISPARFRTARWAHTGALILFGIVLWGLRTTGGHSLLARVAEKGMTVSPGDVALERGSSLVVVARFGSAPPAKVDLVIDGLAVSNRSIPMVKSLADPMFGGSVAEVATNLVYHIEYGGERTRDFKVSVFDYPKLERADAELTYPDYTGQKAQQIKDTRRLSAVEGSRVDLSLQLNKPVKSARLVPKGREESAITLLVETNRAGAALKQFRLETNQTYELRLVDADNRTNKVGAQFVFEALKNRPPEIKLATPRGDIRPSALEEISFEGTVWDDFGVQKYGLAYAVAGQEPKFIELGQPVPGKEKKAFQHTLRLEDLGLEADSLVSWFVWAEDLDSTGKERRSSGDLFFAEVRPFDEVFREGQGQQGGQRQSGGANGQGGDPVTKLTELQKQIINATWKLQREQALKSTPVEKPRSDGTTKRVSMARENVRERTRDEARPVAVPASAAMMFGQRSKSGGSSDPLPRKNRPAAEKSLPVGKSGAFSEDLVVVREAVAQALEQAQSNLEEETDPRASGLWAEVISQMQKAQTQLEQAAKNPGSLSEALAAAQKAYAALLRVSQQREYSVNRRRNQSQQGSSSSREQQMQRQLGQMDLTQEQDRYETQRQAQAPQTPERREQLQVMNRLQELARRQQDVNDRLKELQTALQEARTEQEREEIRRRLKRLQEEEQQMLADVDELRQRMDQPENQSRMAEERRQLEETRSDMQRAAEAARQGSAAQALASGTRAQRQLQEMRDQMRKENSSQFANDLREMRAEARDLARQQEDIATKMQEDNRSTHKSLSDTAGRQELVNRLERQTERLTNLVDRATQVSQDAEAAEPLLSRQLYDTVRKFSQDSAKGVKDAQNDLLNRGLMTRGLYDRLTGTAEPDGAKLMETTAELLRQDFLPQANAASQRVRSNLDGLKRGMERAAESVLGDDTEALRLAKQQLDQLMDQLQQENPGAGSSTGKTNQSQASAAKGTGKKSGKQPGNEPGAGAERSGQQPGAGETAQAAPQESPPADGTPSADTAQGKAGSAPGEQQASANEGQSGNGQQPGKNPTPSDQPGVASGRPGEPSQDPQGNPGEGTRRNGAQGGSRNTSGSDNNNNNDGHSGGSGRFDLDRFLEPDAGTQGGPLTGDNFVPWSDRLREVEEMVDVPELRNSVASARERARLLRQEFKRDQKKPDWAVVRLQVIKPLVEVRDRIAEELARRNSTASLVPIDRDPVPNEYSELVRRYYEELGKDK